MSETNQTTNEKANTEFTENVEDLSLIIEANDSKPNAWTPAMWRLYGILLPIWFCSIFDGFDGSIMSSINDMPPYLDYFHMTSTDASSGLFLAMSGIGGVAVIPFVAPVNDYWGRKWGIWIGSVLVIISSCLSGAAQNKGMFLSGRFFYGFGWAFLNTSAAMLVVELSHPYWRSSQSSLYNSFWGIGSIAATWTGYGLSYASGNIAWRLPLFLPLTNIVPLVISMFFIPESPRWLVAQSREEEARAILTKYHGEGDPNNVYVRLEMFEMQQQIEKDGADKDYWDYRPLFKDREGWRRFLCYGGMAVIGHYSGNGTMGTYFPEMMKISGIESTHMQLLLNSLNSVFPWISSMVGALVSNRVGRRPLLISTQIFAALCFFLMYGLTKYSIDSKTKSAANASIFFSFLFNVIYGFAWTPLTTLYSVETHRTENRAKGVMVVHLIASGVAIMSQYTGAIALGNISYKYYLFWGCWDLLEVVYMYFFFVETKGLTLEEMNIVFQQKNPVKASLKRDHLHVIAETAGVELDEDENHMK